MLSGLLNADNLAEVLRALSQRRLSGRLELAFPEGETQVVFAQGRIVDVAQAGVGMQPLVERLYGCGLVGSPFHSAAGSYAELFMEAGRHPGTRPLGSDLFALMVKHWVLERLYGLDFGAGVPYHFRTQTAGRTAEFCPSISIGQLLLDLAALTSAQAEVADRFPSGGVARTEAAPDFKSEEERRVYEMVERDTAIDDLWPRSPLGLFQTRTALLGLSASGLVKDCPVPAAGRARLDLQPAEDRGGASKAPAAPAELAMAEDEAEDAPRGLSLSVWSAALLHQTWPVRLAAYALVLFAMAAPLFWWGEVFAKFGRF